MASTKMLSTQSEERSLVLQNSGDKQTPIACAEVLAMMMMMMAMMMGVGGGTVEAAAAVIATFDSMMKSNRTTRTSCRSH